MIKEKAAISVKFVDIDLSSVRARNELFMSFNGSLRDRKIRYQIKFSADAILFLRQLQERAQVIIDESENPVSANAIAVNNLRKLLYLSQIKARGRVVGVSARLRRQTSLRPIVAAVDIQKALKTLCPIWPFC